MVNGKAGSFKTIALIASPMGDKRKLWFATGNIGKIAEAQLILGPLGYEVSKFTVAGQAPEIIEPQADWLEEVAMEKLRQAREILAAVGKGDDAVMVEDSGLFVSSLNDFPGVYSAYALKTIGNMGMLRLMAEQDDRSAAFHAVAALWDGTKNHFGSGRCNGRIAEVASGDHGFGFDPIFIPNDLDSEGVQLAAGKHGVVSTDGLTFGAVDMEVKQKFSHRRRALEALFSSIS